MFLATAKFDADTLSGSKPQVLLDSPDGRNRCRNMLPTQLVAHLLYLVQQQ